MHRTHIASAGDYDPEILAEIKAHTGITVSVCLPAWNEEATVGAIVERVRHDLVDTLPLVDELIVIDDGSTDRTASEARAAGATVLSKQSILNDLPPGSGKGDALWKSVYASTGDIICWLDADLEKFGSHFVTGLIGPLITRPETQFVKGFYRRPLDDDPHGGGRVTELMARPVICKFFPDLAEIVQPLGGEYAARRAVLEQIPFVQGWGVELGMLVDISTRWGMASLAQVDLGIRHHRHHPTRRLSTSAMAILTIALRRAGVPDADSWGHVLLRQRLDGTLEEQPVEVRERPPMIEIEAYRTRTARPGRPA